MQLYHGTRNDALVAHVGLCLTDSQTAATRYGDTIYTVELPENIAIRRVEVTREQIDNNDWPGDSAASIADLQADGVDVVLYLDMDPNGNEHLTYRIISRAALVALEIA